MKRGGGKSFFFFLSWAVTIRLPTGDFPNILCVSWSWSGRGFCSLLWLYEKKVSRWDFFGFSWGISIHCMSPWYSGFRIAKFLVDVAHSGKPCSSSCSCCWWLLIIYIIYVFSYLLYMTLVLFVYHGGDYSVLKIKLWWWIIGAVNIGCYSVLPNWSGIDSGDWVILKGATFWTDAS